MIVSTILRIDVDPPTGPATTVHLLLPEDRAGAVVTAISAWDPILTIFLALKYFDERVKILPLAGAFVGIIGVVVLSLG